MVGDHDTLKEDLDRLSRRAARRRRAGVSQAPHAPGTVARSAAARVMGRCAASRHQRVTVDVVDFAAATRRATGGTATHHRFPHRRGADPATRPGSGVHAAAQHQNVTAPRGALRAAGGRYLRSAASQIRPPDPAPPGPRRSQGWRRPLAGSPNSHAGWRQSSAASSFQGHPARGHPGPPQARRELRSDPGVDTHRRDHARTYFQPPLRGRLPRIPAAARPAPPRPPRCPVLRYCARPLPLAACPRPRPGPAAPDSRPAARATRRVPPPWCASCR